MRKQHFYCHDPDLSPVWPATASDWECCYTRLRFDMSRIFWVLTSNNRKAIPEPLRDRCCILDISALSYEDELDFIRTEGERRLGTEHAELLAEAFARQCQGRAIGLRKIMRILENASFPRRIVLH